MKNKFLILFITSFLWTQYLVAFTCEDPTDTSEDYEIKEIEFIQKEDNKFDIFINFSKIGSSVKAISLSFSISETEYVIPCRPIGVAPTTSYLFAENVVLLDLLPGIYEDIKIISTIWSAGGPNPCNECPSKFATKELEINVLPVIWHNFSAKLSPGGKSAELNWSTLKEWESSHFEIERSINGIASYKKIGEEQSVGWSDTETKYNFLDRNLPAAGSRLYYRIRQVDFDGTFDYSPTQMVEIPRPILKTGWQAYPNPTQGQYLYVRSSLFIRKRENPITIKMYSLDASQCITFETFESEIDLSSYLQKFPKGLLIVEIISDETLETLKVLHQ